MKRLVVLGGGTAGTMAANKLRRRLRRDDWTITVVDRDDEHYYQPGFLFVPFGRLPAEQIVRPRQQLHPGRRRPRPWRGRPGRRRAQRRRARPTGASCPTTTWSSRPARRRGPDQTPGMLGDGSGGAASSTSTR